MMQMLCPNRGAYSAIGNSIDKMPSWACPQEKDNSLSRNSCRELQGQTCACSFSLDQIGPIPGISTSDSGHHTGLSVRETQLSVDTKRGLENMDVVRVYVSSNFYFSLKTCMRTTSKYDHFRVDCFVSGCSPTKGTSMRTTRTSTQQNTNDCKKVISFAHTRSRACVTWQTST